ncbi:MAG: PhnD/SsuA/transferrin family substrate-binding protein [Ardenticatenaceae bacterium]|nr:PhnD/SsuA/transferrin family substrate-binding protein [Ardenticatenaceae bacterium]
MTKIGLIAAWGLLVLLAACQPQVMEVEVTRLIDNAPVEAAVTAVATSSPVQIEVTRLITTEVVQEIPVEVTKAPLGTNEHPVQIMFSPASSPAVIMTRGQVLADALSTATGQQFVVGVADDEAALIDLMCTAPADIIGVLSPLGVVQANQQCGVQPGSIAVHSDDLSWQAGMIVARRDSGITALTDLEGKRGAVPDVNSLPNALAIETMLQQAGITPAEIIEVPGDNSAMLAVFDGEVDFAVGTFTPPIMPHEERLWEYGVDSPDISRVLGIAPERSPIGYVLVIGEPEFGGYRLRDARAGIFDIQPEIYNQTRVVALTPQIPNETVAFGRDFPLALARRVIAEMQTFAASEACADSLCASDFYNWRGLEPATDAQFDPVRDIVASGVLAQE